MWPQACNCSEHGACVAGVSKISALPRLESLNLTGLDHLSDGGVAALCGAYRLQQLVVDRCGRLTWAAFPYCCNTPAA